MLGLEITQFKLQVRAIPAVASINRAIAENYKRISRLPYVVALSRNQFTARIFKNQISFC